MYATIFLTVASLVAASPVEEYKPSTTIAATTIATTIKATTVPTTTTTIAAAYTTTTSSKSQPTATIIESYEHKGYVEPVVYTSPTPCDDPAVVYGHDGYHATAAYHAKETQPAYGVYNSASTKGAFFGVLLSGLVMLL
ncbi:hypothetical protein HDV02_002241 [Globomyces sp. JEL0801]|nr:hypothetical protein HDV02_002241 [Globomyces sp. JEL0801]